MKAPGNNPTPDFRKQINALITNLFSGLGDFIDSFKHQPVQDIPAPSTGSIIDFLKAPFKSLYRRWQKVTKAFSYYVQELIKLIIKNILLALLMPFVLLYVLTDRVTAFLPKIDLIENIKLGFSVSLGLLVLFTIGSYSLFFLGSILFGLANLGNKYLNQPSLNADEIDLKRQETQDKNNAPSKQAEIIYLLDTVRANQQKNKVLNQLYGQLSNIDQSSADRLLGRHRGLNGQALWLNDKIVNDYIEYLTQRPNEKAKKKICYVNSLLFADEALYTKHINQLGKNAKRNLKVRRKELKAADIIFIPVYVDNNHWHLQVIQKIEPTQYAIYGLDGFNQAVKHQENSAKAKRLLDKLYEELKSPPAVKILDCPIPQQKNEEDCGVIASFYAYLISVEGKSLADANKYTCDTDLFREHMAECLIKHHKEESTKSNRSALR